MSKASENHTNRWQSLRIGIRKMFRKLFSKNDKFEDVRIEEIKPFEKDLEKKTSTVWFQQNNIERSIQAVYNLGIEQIHLQTNTIDFLSDSRLKNVKGIFVQHLVDDLSLLYGFPNLTHLGISEDNKKEFDYSHFKDLIYLSGTIPRKYKNLNSLKNLKYTYLFDFKRPDFKEFSQMKDIRKIEIYNVNCENLHGLSGLTKLKELNLEKCPKLSSSEGIDSSNGELKNILLKNCKNLHDLSQLKEVHKLEHLYLSKVNQLDSLDFLKSLNSLNFLFIHPSNVGVKSDDYYPLIEKLKQLDKLDQLKSWRKLRDYLDKKVDVSSSSVRSKSELQLIIQNLSIRSWIENLDDGLEQYSEENCSKVINIFEQLISSLESSTDLTEENKINYIKNAVLRLNKLNDELDHSLIETGEREELSDIFDNIADTVNIDIQKYDDGIASEWREW